MAGSRRKGITMKHMTRYLILFFFTVILSAPAFSDETGNVMKDRRQALEEAASLDEQLAILDEIANGEEQETVDWDVSLSVNLAPGLTQGLLPEDWEEYGYAETDGFPEELRDHKCIVINGTDTLNGDILSRLPAAMRASHLEEAEYAIVIDSVLTESGYEYVISTTSFHRDYSGYILDLGTGEAVRFWFQRNSAKSFGTIGDLNGDLFSEKEIWNILRSQLLKECRYVLEDGTCLVFGTDGQTCFLKGYEGEPEKLEIPAQVEDCPVTEIAGRSFYDCDTLQRLVLPEGLKVIGEESFGACDHLASVILSEGVEVIEENAFIYTDKMACCYLPASLTQGLSDAGLDRHTGIYAPEGSYALQWAQENGYVYTVCDSPAGTPATDYLTEGDFTFLTCGEEAALYAYLGSDSEVVIPGTAGGYPVTGILKEAVDEYASAESIVLPESTRFIHEDAICAADNGLVLHVYIPNPETALEPESISRRYSTTPIILHAPEDSLARQYVTDTASETIRFEAWEGNEEEQITAEKLDWPENGELYKNPDIDRSETQLVFTYGNETDAARYIKIYTADQILARTLFLGGSGQVKTMLPGGTYTIRVGTGQDWYGEEFVFGKNGSYGILTDNGEQAIELKAAYSYEISLAAVQPMVAENGIGIEYVSLEDF